MAKVIKIVTIQVENDTEDMAIAQALDLFNDMNPDGVTLTWIDEYSA